MHIRFEWDAVKAASNLAKHGVSFEEAIAVFADSWALMTQDRIEGQEQRWQTIGLVGGHLMLLVAHTVGEDGNGMEIIRIVSARTADRKERERYENQDR